MDSTGSTHAALPGEEAPFAQHCRAFLEALALVGLVEEALAEDIAADRWRLKRARAMENALFAQIERQHFGELTPTPLRSKVGPIPLPGSNASPFTPAAFNAPSTRTPPSSKPSRPLDRRSTPKLRKRRSSSPQTPNPKAKPTTRFPISRPLPKPSLLPAALPIQPPKSRVSSVARART